MDKAIYENNKKVLEVHHPELLSILDCPGPRNRFQILQAKSGAYRLTAKTSSGQIIGIHNAEDPIQVAERTAHQIQGHSNSVLVLMGMGLGYLARALAQHLHKGSALIVYESDPDLFQLALQLVDLTDVLAHSRIKILVGEDARIEPWCYQYMLETGGNVFIIRYEPALRLYPEVYERKIHQELVRFTTGAMINLATASRFGPIFTKSILEAVPHLMTAYGVQELKGLFPGRPAIVVAAGPSLEKNCHLLKAVKGRAVIIAADTVIGYLLARGIQPDFVVSVDPQDDTIMKYEGVSMPKEVALVFHPSCNDWIVKHFPGPKFVTETSMMAYQWLKEFWPSKGTIEGEIQCQVHMGFNLAQWMGCDPVMLIGLDLCYTDNLVHVKGGTYFHEGTEAGWVEEKGQPTKNIFGEPVKADPVFFGYKNTWETKIKKFTGTVINATEGGIGLTGADNWLFSDAIQQFCQVIPLDIPKTILLSANQRHEVNLDGLIVEVKDRIRDLFRLERASGRVCRLLDRLEHLRKNSDVGSPALERVSQKAERLTSLVPRYSKTLGLLQLVDFNLELYMSREDTAAADFVEDEIERLDQQIIRGKRYYGALRQATPLLRKQLERLHHRLEIIRKWTPSSAQVLSRMDMLHFAKTLASIECFDQAGDYFSQFLTNAQKEPLGEEAVRLGIAIGLGQGDPEMAWSYAKQATSLRPEKTDMRKLCELAKKNWDRWMRRKSEVAHLPEDPQPVPFYAGDFYFRIKNFPFAERHYRRIAEDGQYNDQQRGEAYFRMFKIRQCEGDREQGVWALEQALHLRPTDPRIYYELGVIALQGELIEHANRFFLKGTEVSFDDEEFCEAVAAVYCAAGLHGQAIPFYEKALRQNPVNPDLLKKISSAYHTMFAGVPST